jgi:hypothetical protein
MAMLAAMTDCSDSRAFGRTAGSVAGAVLEKVWLSRAGAGVAGAGIGSFSV